jgi:hypothetical protein
MPSSRATASATARVAGQHDDLDAGSCSRLTASAIPAGPRRRLRTPREPDRPRSGRRTAWPARDASSGRIVSFRRRLDPSRRSRLGPPTRSRPSDLAARRDPGSPRSRRGRRHRVPLGPRARDDGPRDRVLGVVLDGGGERERSSSSTPPRSRPGDDAVLAERQRARLVEHDRVELRASSSPRRSRTSKPLRAPSVVEIAITSGPRARARADRRRPAWRRRARRRRRPSAPSASQTTR